MKTMRFYLFFRMGFLIVLSTACAILLTSPVFALHPLITDDTGTQGKGMFELEFNYEYDRDEYSEVSRDPREVAESYLEGQSVFGKISVKDDTNVAGVAVTYGIIDPLDISIGIPYQHTHVRERHLYYIGPLQFLKLKENETVSRLSDVIVEFKWKFYEYKFLSFTLKPGFVIPTGDEDNGLGAGKFGLYGYFISTLDFGRAVMHLNLGYKRNQNRGNEREDLWHASLASEFWVIREYLRLVANIGLDRNPDKRSNVHDVYVMAGIIGSPTPDIDLDLGFKYCIQSKKWESSGPDYSVLAGVTIRFGMGAGGEKDNEK